MKAPYQWFGGKSTMMPEVWRRLGDTRNFVDPFLGSNAPLLSRPGWDWDAGQWSDDKGRIETVNDKDCYVANFQRALKHEPDAVAEWCDDPINEADLHARHLWLVRQDDFIERMKTDPDFFDVKVAGWWVWGLCQWIGGGWCERTTKQRPHLLDAGMGVHRRRPHLGDAGIGVHRKRPNLWHYGAGVHSQSIRQNIGLYEYFQALSARMRRVRVCCGDWSRIAGPTPTYHNGLTAVILDPPYSAEANRVKNIYATDSLTVAHDVRRWAIENGDNPLLRIALFGYMDEHDAEMPGDWERLRWTTQGGYSNRSNGQGMINKTQECIWFSPHCLKIEQQQQLSLFEETI